MVFIIPSSPLSSIVIASHMLNIENNQNLFHNGDLTETPLEKFNVYCTEDYDIDIQCNYGTIIYYGNITDNALIMSITTAIDEILNNNPIDNLVGNRQPIIHEYSKTYTHLQECNIEVQPQFIRIFIRQNDSKNRRLLNNSFVWNIIVVKPNGLDGYLNIFSKISSKECPSPEYHLNKSFSTIIYDSLGVFNSSTPLRQIPYPYLEQTTLSNRIITEPVVLSLKYGILFDIFKYHIKENNSVQPYLVNEIVYYASIYNQPILVQYTDLVPQTFRKLIKIYMVLIN